MTELYFEINNGAFMRQNVLRFIMGNRCYSQMVLLEIIILLTFAQPLPVSKKHLPMFRGNDKLRSSSVEKGHDDLMLVNYLKKDFNLNLLKTKTGVEESNSKRTLDLMESSGKSKRRHSGTNTKLSKYNTSSHRLSRRKRYAINFENMENNIINAFEDDNVVDSNFENTHVVPCGWENRQYCHHGGICVFVKDLDIKTCRCPIKYTGPRCEMLDLGYMMRSLMGGSIDAFEMAWL